MATFVQAEAVVRVNSSEPTVWDGDYSFLRGSEPTVWDGDLPQLSYLLFLFCRSEPTVWDGDFASNFHFYVASQFRAHRVGW
jgi:hypothetical protein